jgi:hypothetical protein
VNYAVNAEHDRGHVYFSEPEKKEKKKRLRDGHASSIVFFVHILTGSSLFG